MEVLHHIRQFFVGATCISCPKHRAPKTAMARDFSPFNDTHAQVTGGLFRCEAPVCAFIFSLAHLATRSPYILFLVVSQAFFRTPPPFSHHWRTAPGYMVPVVGKLLQCGDCILQGEERSVLELMDFWTIYLGKL